MARKVARKVPRLGITEGTGICERPAFPTQGYDTREIRMMAVQGDAFLASEGGVVDKVLPVFGFNHQLFNRLVRVHIASGLHCNDVGILVEDAKRGWTVVLSFSVFVEMKPGEVLTAHFLACTQFSTIRGTRLRVWFSPVTGLRLYFFKNGTMFLSGDN